MALTRLATSMLLASVIFLLYWTASSARSHDLPSADLSPLCRVKRDTPEETREKVATSLEVIKDVLNVIKEGIGERETEQLTAVMKGLSNIASWAPGIGGLVASLINVVLAFIPQDDPVLNEVKAGFSEVNRKLDSLSIQLSNLATDVEWFNYASVYSQDEVRILNGWKKFNEYRLNSDLAKSDSEKLRLAEIFTNYYEYTGTEASVANLYHYLTVSSTSLSENINVLLRKKFKCDIREIGRYNIYFSSLLWKGMVLNQLYWRLIGFNPSGKEIEHTRMFKNVYSAQMSALDFCLDKKNYKQYIKKDVEEIRDASSPDNTTAIAVRVKDKLDSKYSWYNWVVQVHDTDEEVDKEDVFYNMMKLTGAKTSVAVGYVQKTDDGSQTTVKDEVNNCFEEKTKESTIPSHVERCDIVKLIVTRCSPESYGDPVVKVMNTRRSSPENNIARIPGALLTLKCRHSWNGYWNDISFYFSKTPVNPCDDDPCQNGGQCKRLLDSSQYLCECSDGWRGDSCETPMNPSTVPKIDKESTVPDITTLSSKLKLMEATLGEILSVVKDKCPA